MTRYLIRRLLQMVPMLLGIAVVSFLLIHLAPGDPIVALAGEYGNAAYYEFMRAKFGLDRPLTEQLLVYLTNVLRGLLHVWAAGYAGHPLTAAGHAAADDHRAGAIQRDGRRFRDAGGPPASLAQGLRHQCPVPGRTRNPRLLAGADVDLATGAAPGGLSGPGDDHRAPPLRGPAVCAGRDAPHDSPGHGPGGSPTGPHYPPDAHHSARSSRPGLYSHCLREGVVWVAGVA